MALKQITRFQAEVYRLAAAADVHGGGGGRQRAGVMEKEWCALWQCAVPLWRDTHVGISDVRSQSDCLSAPVAQGIVRVGGQDKDKDRAIVIFFCVCACDHVRTLYCKSGRAGEWEGKRNRKTETGTEKV